MRPSPRTEIGHRQVKLRHAHGGFTLTELLVVILIIVLLSAATLPAILPALNSRRVSEGSRLLQSEFARARDAAVRANAPRGFRLIPDPIQLIPDPNNPTGPLIFERKRTSSRLVPIEPAPDYSEGAAVRLGRIPAEYPNPPGTAPPSSDPNPPANLAVLSALAGTSAGSSPAYLPGPTFSDYLNQANQLLIVHEVKFEVTTLTGVRLPSPPTSWFWNIRQGDKMQLNGTGPYYTVVGPMRIGPNPNPGLAAPDNTMTNPERYINFGSSATYQTGPASQNYEFLILANGTDDDKDGFTDEMFDGVDNDGDGVVDPGFNGIDDDSNGVIDDFGEIFLHVNSNGSFSYPGVKDPTTGALTFGGPFLSEFEPEQYSPIPGRGRGGAYTISRRPVPSEGAREVALPTNVVIDLTTSANPLSERSRVPTDLTTTFVDVLIAPNGQVMNGAAGTNLAPPVNFPFYHFWLSEREDAAEPFPVALKLGFQLPMPRGTRGDPRIDPNPTYPANLPGLKGERRLLSVNTRTGAITSTAIETFYLNNPSYPFEAAEAGVKDALP
ncbi:MAG: pilE [Planctomycetota bacterium]|nr:pilE [Planctomycetota bacterium]